MEARNLAAVGLSLMLAANCCLPCYTLAYADESQEVVYVSQEEQEEVSADNTGGLEFSPGVGESSADGADGGSAAEGHGADDGASAGAGEDTSSDYGGLVLTSDLPLYSARASVVDTVGQTWGSVKDTVSASWGLVKDYLTWFYDGSTSWQTNISTSDKVKIIPQFTTLNLLKQQWGYNYGTGNTIVWAKNSPAGWLNSIYSDASTIKSYLFAPAHDGNSYSVGYFLRFINQRAEQIKTNTDSINNYSSLIRENTDLTQSYLTALDGDGTRYSAAYFLRYINDKLAGIRSYASSIDRFSSLIRDNTNLTQSYLFAPGHDGNSYSAAFFLSYINSKVDDIRSYSSILDVATKGPEGGRVSLYNIGNAVETIKNETRDLDNLLQSVYDRLSALDALGVRLANIALTADDIRKSVNSSVQWSEVLHGDLSLLRHGAADLLPGYADWTLWDFLQGIYFDIGQIVDLLKGLQQTLTAWGNRWDSQDLYLMEWAKRWDALDKGGTWSESDKGALFAKLDGISDRLSVEAGQTVLDALLGEVKPQYINDQLTIVKEVARNRFPFCIPAMMQQMLGLMQSEAQVPHWEFDFFGSPLVLDLGDLESFALVTRWASCFMLFLALLANTKRFIFDLGGGGK